MLCVFNVSLVLAKWSIKIQHPILRPHYSSQSKPAQFVTNIGHSAYNIYLPVVSEFWRTWCRAGWEMSPPTTTCLLTTRLFTSTGNTAWFFMAQTFFPFPFGFVYYLFLHFCPSICVAVCLCLSPAGMPVMMMASVYSVLKTTPFAAFLWCKMYFTIFITLNQGSQFSLFQGVP